MDVMTFEVEEIDGGFTGRAVDQLSSLKTIA